MGKLDRSVRPAPLLLKAFLVRHGLTLREAGALMQIAHPTIYQWLTGFNVPKAHFRRRVAIWTRNEVPESSWLTAEEASEADKVKPFKPAKKAPKRRKKASSAALESEPIKASGTD